jgi:hypothetical protein
LVKAVKLLLAINPIGTLLRIFMVMTFIVILFTIFSFFIFFLLTYAVHMLYKGEDLNASKFQSFYFGLMYVYEFTFGAVEYHKSNDPTYLEMLMNLILIFISFFGNIMFANILIAFLSSEYDAITKNADYEIKST